ncbi:Uncharacterized protein FWK35_00010646 [Aphis craccivora]|uniref:Uncharacterized protein n=1 Tax=Aphis craccivora TaxID=307492 RepID=A0A6G0ZH01_APHCR|nr:Uncharacterized protein FWK35_00010646 [Aphis craccivora]
MSLSRKTSYEGQTDNLLYKRDLNCILISLENQFITDFRFFLIDVKRIYKNEAYALNSDLLLISYRICVGKCFESSLTIVKLNPRRNLLTLDRYENIINFLNLKTLKDRKKQFYITFLFKLLNNIDDSSLLCNIILKTTNTNTRNKELFYIKPYTQNYMSCTPIIILLSSGNSNKLFQFSKCDTPLFNPLYQGHILLKYATISDCIQNGFFYI